ncbi:MAG: PAS domain-containing protein, partial [Cyanobacteria bacterium J06648_11]
MPKCGRSDRGHFNRILGNQEWYRRMTHRSQRTISVRWQQQATLLLACVSLSLVSGCIARSQPRASFTQSEVRAQPAQVPLLWAGGAFLVGFTGGAGIFHSLLRKHATVGKAMTQVSVSTELSGPDRDLFRGESSPVTLEDTLATEAVSTIEVEFADSDEPAGGVEPAAGSAEAGTAELFDVLFESHASLVPSSTVTRPDVPEPELAPSQQVERSEVELAVLQCARDAILILDDSLSVVESNPATAALLGYAATDMLGRDAIALLFPAAERPQFRSDARQFLSAESGPWAETREIYFQHADGSLVPLEWTTHRFTLAGEPHILAFARDTAPYKRAEAALQASEERYDLAVRGSNDGLWDWDLLTSRIEFSPRWKEMLGYEEREISENPDEWFERVHPDDRDRLVAEITAHIKGETDHFESEHRILRRDRTYMWVFSRGLAVRNERNFAYRLAGSQTDITERRKAEENAYRDAL